MGPDPPRESRPSGVYPLPMSEWWLENVGWLLTAFSILAAIATWSLGRRHELATRKEAAAIGLYDEFCSADALRHRIEADKTLRRVLGEKAKSERQLYGELSTEDWLPISRVMHFFERLEISIRAGVVDEPLALTLFGKSFWYFWFEYLQHMHSAAEEGRATPNYDDMWRDLLSLERRMKSHASPPRKLSTILRQPA